MVLLKTCFKLKVSMLCTLIKNLVNRNEDEMTVTEASRKIKCIKQFAKLYY